jgi:hypothetical protein
VAMSTDCWNRSCSKRMKPEMDSVVANKYKEARASPVSISVALPSIKFQF